MTAKLNAKVQTHMKQRAIHEAGPYTSMPILASPGMLTMILAALLACSNAVMAATPPTLVLRYEFSNQAVDTSGHGNDGIVHGATISGGNAVFNNPQGVPNADQYIILPTTGLASLSGSSFTIAIRYKTTDSGLLNGRLFANGSIILDYNSGGKDAAYAGLGGVNIGYDGPLANNSRVTDGQYHWQVLTYDSVTSTAKHYLDGRLTGEAVVSPSLIKFDNLYLGADSAGLSYGAKDTSVDELRIYQGVASMAEISMGTAAPSVIQDSQTLDNNAVPPGWTFLQRWGNTSISNGRLNATPVDANAYLIAPIVTGDTVTRIEMSWDGNLEYNEWGMGPGAGVETRSGKIFTVAHGHANYNFPGVTFAQFTGYSSYTVWNDSTKYFNTVVPRPILFGNFHYSLVVEAGRMVFRAVSTDTGVETFNLEFDDPSIQIADTVAVVYIVHATSGPATWLDNPQYKVTATPAAADCSQELAAANDTIAALQQQLVATSTGSNSLFTAVTDLQQQLIVSAAAASDLQRQLAASSATNAETAAQLALSQQQLAEATASNSSLSNQLASAQHQLADSSAQNANLQTQLSASEQQLATALAANANLTTQLTSTQQQLADALSSRAILQGQLLASQLQVADVQAANSNLQTQLASTQQQLANATASNASLQSQLSTSQQQLSGALAANSNLTAQLTSVQTQIDRVTAALRAEFKSPTFIIPGADTVARVRALVDAILQSNHGQLEHIYDALVVPIHGGKSPEPREGAGSANKSE